MQSPYILHAWKTQRRLVLRVAERAGRAMPRIMSGRGFPLRQR
jgi:hypothetical protein